MLMMLRAGFGIAGLLMLVMLEAGFEIATKRAL